MKVEELIEHLAQHPGWAEVCIATIDGPRPVADVERGTRRAGIGGRVVVLASEQGLEVVPWWRTRSG